MAYWAVYKTASKELVSTGSVVASPLPAGLAAKDIGTDPGDALWDAATLAFVPRPAEVIKTVRDRFLEQPEIVALTAANRTKVMAAFDRTVT